jgi:parallel beta-helix repeat protein
MLAKAKQLIVLSAIFILLTVLPISATIINVPAEYDTIQVAINASSNGDTILVAEGHYYERINFNSKRILLTSNFMLDNDTLHIQNTIIDADTLVLGLADTCSVVCFVNGEDSTSIIQGFTLQNGVGTSYYYPSRAGGGIYCNRSSPTIIDNIIIGNSADDGGGIDCSFYSSPKIINNVITENSAIWVGAGICFFYHSSPLISKNTISDNFAGWGGGFFCRYFCFPTIINNNIVNNSVIYYGGGIYCRDKGNPIITKNIISDNIAMLGGGIYCSFNSNPQISYNAISENIATWGGGGIYNSRNSSPTINKNTISRNISEYYGAGIYFDQSSSIVSNNSLIENSTSAGGAIYSLNSFITLKNNLLNANSAYYGGGIFCQEDNITIINNTITENSASYFGGAIYMYNSFSEILNTILWSNMADSSGNEIFLYDNRSSIIITYSNIQGSWEGEGNIDEDPLFRDPNNGNFHLMSTYCNDSLDSPLIDMGYPDLSDSLLDCDWGLRTERSDMGAYGGGNNQAKIDEYIIQVSNQFTLSQNYPNPFNPTTTISFTIDHPQFVTLKVYDLLGREVSTLIDNDRQAGQHTVLFDASELTSGIYFYRLQAGYITESKRMVLLK